MSASSSSAGDIGNARCAPSPRPNSEAIPCAIAQMWSATIKAGGRPAAEKPLAPSYAELEIAATVSDPEVVKAYRRQMSRHHPDKLVANGLPESMAQIAKEKTQRIQEAYEAIRAARGMR